ncbi:MAG: NlpC/P60 family protein [Mycobacteriales bacterium]
MQILVPTIVAVVGLVLAPNLSAFATAAPAAPSAAEASKMHAALSAKMAKATEEYDMAGVLLARSLKQEKVLRAQAAVQQKKVTVYENEVADFAASAYRGGRIDMITSLLQSGSPQNFLDQMSTLDNLSHTQRLQLNRLIAAKRVLDDQQAKIAAAMLSQRQSQSTIKTRRTAIQKDLKTWQALDSKLNPGSGYGGSVGGSYTGPATGNARVALQAAYNQLGKPYSWGAAGPNSFDCSGLTMFAWGKAGVSLPHSSRMQYSYGHKVARADLQPGDLVFAGSPIHHVGMYVGNGKMIHAPQQGDVVRIAPLMSDYVGAVRP